MTTVGESPKKMPTVTQNAHASSAPRRMRSLRSSLRGMVIHASSSTGSRMRNRWPTYSDVESFDHSEMPLRSTPNTRP